MVPQGHVTLNPPQHDYQQIRALASGQTRLSRNPALAQWGGLFLRGRVLPPQRLGLH
jgi:hypothetical protein